MRPVSMAALAPWILLVAQSLVGGITGRASAGRVHAPTGGQVSGIARPALADTDCVARGRSTRPAPTSTEGADTTKPAPAFERAIRAHLACIGMSADMLRRSWGLPPTIIGNYTSGGSVSDSTEQYEYPDYIVILHNSRIVAIRRRSR